MPSRPKARPRRLLTGRRQGALLSSKIGLPPAPHRQTSNGCSYQAVPYETKTTQQMEEWIKEEKATEEKERKQEKIRENMFMV
mmetsp:Transcript_73193/g.238035  ORF Transcript_73193/g.238035 Transcript_73193/m.238035 type:complete len:83 (-) Transcript_73193:800-1048(-)